MISPLLANVYLHHVLDDWFAREWRPREVRGEAYIVRYADDFVLGFQYRSDAVRFMEAMRERFAAFGLGVHPEKTRLLEFGRFAMSGPCEARGGSTGDVRLPRLHALLPDEAQWALRSGPETGPEADAPDAEGHQGRVA